MEKSKHKPSAQKSQAIKSSTPPPPVVKTAPAISLFRLQQIIIFSLAVILYINTVPFEYALDDKLYITKNEYTKKGLGGLQEILTNDLLTGFYGIKKDLVAGGRYRPLSMVTYAIEWEIFGENPHVSHFVNVMLYAFTCVFLFVLLTRLLRGYKYQTPVFLHQPLDIKHFTSIILHLPFLATILFTAHPLHTEVVANIKGRDDIMCFLGSLGALHFMMRYFEKETPRGNDHLNILWSCLCLFLGILTKETAVTFVAAIPVTLFFFTKCSVKKILITTVPLGATVLFYIILRYVILGPPGRGTIGELMNNPFVGTTLMEKTATILYTCWLYLKLLIFPHPLTHDYYPKQIPIIGWDDIRAIIPLVIYIIIGIFALRHSFKKNIPAFCFWFFLITFSIASNLIFNVGTFMNERFMYIPTAGYALAVAFFLLHVAPIVIKNNQAAKNVIVSAVILILLLYGVKTISRNYAWQDDYTLATTDVLVSTNSAKCNMSAGGNLVEKAEKEENPSSKDSMLRIAIGYLNKATALHSTYTDAWLLKGNGFALMEDWASSLTCYENVLKISQNHEHALKNIQYVANKTTEKGLFPHARRAYNILLHFHPENGEYLKKTGTFYGKNMNKIDSAIVYLSRALQANPNDGYTYQELGVAHGILGKHREALDYFLKANSFIPNDALLKLNLAITYGFLGDTMQEKKFKEEAFRLDPKLRR